jgi:hypothetical protein
MSAQKDKKPNVREIFLRKFVSQLILNSYSPEQDRTRERLREVKIERPILVQPKETETHPGPLPKKVAKKNVRRAPLRRRIMTSPQRPKKIQKIQEEKPQTLLEQKPVIPSQNIEQVAVNLGKVAQFLRDPSVLSIECPGPRKNILVNRSGAIQTTPLTLTKEEISALIQEISDKTKIPIVPGLFKTAFQDLILTAVISDYVGTRFILQKMSPFQKNY